MNTALILLAAGASTRLGKPKQQLPYRDKTLIQHAMEVALASECSPVIVVLGAYADVIAPTISHEAVHIVENPSWQEGMSSSIRAGIIALQNIAPNTEQTIFMLCDQPFADVALLHRLVQKKRETKKAIIASAYIHPRGEEGRTAALGVPVLFEKRFFTALSLLKGQQGAKKLLLDYPALVATVPFPRGNIDIDTPDDYIALTQRNI